MWPSMSASARKKQMDNSGGILYEEFYMKPTPLFVTITGRGGRDTVNGAKVEGNKKMHLGSLPDGHTACGRPFTGFLTTYSDVKIDCPDCIKKMVKLK